MNLKKTRNFEVLPTHLPSTDSGINSKFLKKINYNKISIILCIIISARNLCSYKAEFVNFDQNFFLVPKFKYENVGTHNGNNT
jgi:hypothetical protein